MKLYANPYAFDASGFYFSSAEEFDKKFKAAEKKGIEEFEIEFIDGEKAEAQLFEAAEINQANIHEWFEFVDSLVDESEIAAAFYALEYLKKDMPEALKLAEDELRPFEGDIEAYAYDYIESIGGVGELGKETIDMYFDYESFGRDIGFDLDADDPDDDRYREMDDRERGEAYVDDVGIEAPLGERYFDYEAFARDLNLGGEITEFEFDGNTWTIQSY